MKAKENIFHGDLLVKDGDLLRKITKEECGEWVGPMPWDYAFDRVKIYGIAGQNSKEGEEVITFPLDNQTTLAVN